MTEAIRDQNHVTVALGVSSSDSSVTLPLQVDPSTGRLKVDAAGGGGGYTNLTQFVDQTAWRLFYSNTDGDVVEFAFGADGSFLMSQGAAAAPVWTSSTGTGNVVRATSPTLVTPALGTPSALVLTNATGLVATTGLTATGTKDSTTFLRGDNTWAVPSGGGSGTVTSVAMTVPTGLLVSGTPITTTGTFAVTLDTGYVIPTQAALDAKAPLASPTFTTSINGAFLTASEILITDASKNIVSAPVATYPSLTELTYVKGVTSAIQTQINAKQATITFGTGVQTALGVNIGSAGAFVTFNGALGTPSSGTVTNLTGTASININGTVGATTPTTGVFTTLVAGSTTSLLLGTAGSAVGNIGFRNATSGTITLAPVTGALGTVTLSLPAATDQLVARATTDTLTNKRITKRTGTTTSSATPTINTDNVDEYYITAQTADITSFTTNLSGTPTEGQLLFIAVTGTAARAITWGASFENGPVALPTTTVTTTRLDTLFKWNTVTSKWRCMATGSTV